MIFDAITVFQTFLHIVYMGILIFGLVICVKKSFYEGIVFFAIFLLNSIYVMFSNRILDNIIMSGRIPLNLTVGEFILVINVILRMFDLVAVVCLAVGLARLLRNYRAE